MAYIPCESCDGQSLEYRNKMWRILQERNIDPQQFIAEEAEGRRRLITEGFGLNCFKQRETLIPKSDIPENQGLVIIKPEIFHAHSCIEEYLMNRLEARVTQATNFVFTPNEYWEMSGRVIFDHSKLIPHGPLLFLSFITATSRLVMFEHKSITDYLKLFKQNNSCVNPLSLLENESDIQHVFNQLFVKNGPNSIRSNVALPIVNNRRLLEMLPNHCPAKCWDFTGTFESRTIEENAMTFNGVHSPNNRQELLHDLSILSRLY